MAMVDLESKEVGFRAYPKTSLELKMRENADALLARTQRLESLLAKIYE